MSNCRNCGQPIPDTAAFCPSCGLSISAPQPIAEQPRFNPSPQGYTPQQQQAYMLPQQGYMSPQQAYMPPQQGVNVTVINTAPPTRSKTPLVVEVILSLFGIYGVGWLMAGETTIGIIWLVCSFVVYWPTLIILALLTFGILDFPVAVACIVINALLLNRALNQDMRGGGGGSSGDNLNVTGGHGAISV